MKLFNRILLIILVALVSIGFVPYKIPVSSDLSENELLIEFTECTCRGEYVVNKHLFHFPKEYQPFYPEGKNFDLKVVAGDFPEGSYEDFDFRQNLIVGNQFKIKGSIVGIDSTYYSNCHNYVAEFKVDKWDTTEYKPMYFTFDFYTIWIYFISLALIIISLVSLTIVRLFIVRKMK